jgi:hypothetical protein
MGEPEVPAAPGNRREPLKNPLAFRDGRRVDVPRSPPTITRACIVMECGASGAKQAAIPPRGSTANRACINANHRYASAQELIDARKPAPAETDDTGVGVYLAGEHGIRNAGVRIPDGRS